ncbi:hypothetical protein, partial [Enterobacter sp. FL1277]|uniref:hypothetical protein n=1 Tax=Enterobacter sp. FL1277 TaxID=2969211 RepID=UPI00214722E4
MVRKSARTKGATAPFPLSELKSLLHYDEATGIFTWLVDQKRRQVKSDGSRRQIRKVSGKWFTSVMTCYDCRTNH